MLQSPHVTSLTGTIAVTGDGLQLLNGLLPLLQLPCVNHVHGQIPVLTLRISWEKSSQLSMALIWSLAALLSCCSR